MRPSLWASARCSAAFTPRCSAAPAWVLSHRLITPTKFWRPHAKDFDIVVFNGHVHTSEIFEVDGIKYLLLGAGGAEQDPILPGRTSIKLPADYPPNLYRKPQPSNEEYSYLIVDLDPGRKTKFTLNRFRPRSAKPFESVEQW
jgi:hypothetical protein